MRDNTVFVAIRADAPNRAPTVPLSVPCQADDELKTRRVHWAACTTTLSDAFMKQIAKI